MRSTSTRTLLAVGILTLGSAVARSGDLKPVELRCEHLVNPMGIDATKPRLSWQLQSAERGQRQTAYQVQVSTCTRESERADLWDSGKVASDATAQIAYAGKPLVSRTRAYWRVRVWDAAGEASAWSEPAAWSMGLLEPSQWKAQWIGRDEPTPTTNGGPLAKASWIWHGVPDANRNYPKGHCWFRRTLELPADRSVLRAVSYFAADNRHELWMNGARVSTGSSYQAAEATDLTELVRPGANVLALDCENMGEGANPAGLIGVVKVEFDRGEPLVLVTDRSWKTAEKKVEGWEKAGLDDSGWPAAHVFGPFGSAPWGPTNLGSEGWPLPARMLRREFVVSSPLRRATVYMSGLGFSELYLNGRKVGDHVLDPIFTDYDKRVAYVTYDVTRQLNEGKNAIGVLLGNGRYFAPRQSVPTGTRTFGYPKLRLQLELEFADGTRQTIVSDPRWKLSTNGPIRENNDYDGEVYDARLEQPGWSRAGFDDGAWQAAAAVSAPSGVLSAPMMPPMRVIQTLKPIGMTSPKPGVWIFDMGQNMVGWCRLKVQGSRGMRIKLRHAETLAPDGTLYVANLRSAKCRDLYFLKGEGAETYEPRFTYHGFRYVELTGYPGKPDVSMLEGRVVHTDLPEVGQFTCSNALVSRIHENIRWGLRGNYLSMPTDCPQRDERQGWQGDRAGECQGETFLFDNLALYRKWMVDIEDSQRADGNLSDVCPAYWQLYSPNVTWPSAFTIIPGTLYRQYGDAGSIARHYEAMRRWMAFLKQFIHDDLIEVDNYGDWCVPPEEPTLIHSQDPARRTSKVVLSTCYYYWNLQLLARYAAMLGKPEDAREYVALAERMKGAFNRKYFHADTGLYDNGTQTSCILPLAFGIAPEKSRERVFENLVRNITEKTHGHVGTGLIGGQWLMRTLTDRGRADLAYRLVSNRTYPSWGYMVEKGATTIWELWNGDTADPAMNSGNHIMLVGDMAAWLYEDLAGIQADGKSPGFKHIVMKPHPVGDLKSVQAEYRSTRGPIRSQWQRDEGKFHWTIAIPANTTATISVPTGDAGSVLESGKPAGQAKGVTLVRTEPGAAVYRIESGRYEFESGGLAR